MIISSSGKSGSIKEALPMYHLMHNYTKSKNEYDSGMGISTVELLKYIIISYSTSEGKSGLKTTPVGQVLYAI